MSEQFVNEPLLDMFLFETEQLIEQLEQSILSSEQECNCFTQDAINEIFRIMHTIKGSSSMMMFNNISTLAHTIEDIFFYLREDEPQTYNFFKLSDLVLEGVDFLKGEVDKIKNCKIADGDSSSLICTMKQFLSDLKEKNKSVNQKVRTDKSVSVEQHIETNSLLDSKNCNTFKAVIYFEDGCEMENIRAYTVIRNLKMISDHIVFIPEDILDNDETVEIIRREGFKIYIKSELTYDKMNDLLLKTIFLKDIELSRLEKEEEIKSIFEKKSKESIEQFDRKSEIVESKKADKNTDSKDLRSMSTPQSIISVSVAKLDKLMDLVGEMVISEAMVIQNPDLQGLDLDNFHKAAIQLNKITTEIQDMVMSIRRVPLSATFNKMHRIVRDMCKKLEKDVKLEIVGEATEVDKNIIEHISDPLMHLVRNSIDHGIETPNERLKKGKPKTGLITLEAKNSGSDVLIIVKDDGEGLDRTKILKKGKRKQFTNKK